MPLIGLSANFIPYILAMVFTMLFINGNTVNAESRIENRANSYVKQIIFTENTGATPSEFHYSDFTTQTTEALTSVYLFFIDEGSSGHTGYYLFSPCCSFIHTISHRGPPVS